MSLYSQIKAAPNATAPEKPVESLAKVAIADLGITATAGEVSAADFAFRGAPVGHSADLDRILGMPRRTIEAEKDQRAADAWTAHLRRENPNCDCVKRWGFCITSLRPVQGWGLEEASNADGLLGAVGVGHGKEGLCILAPWAFEGCKCAVLMLPANLRAQLLHRDFPQWAAHFKVPSLAGGPFTVGRPVLYVMTYNDLSSPKSSDLLRSISPDVIILNECQNLARREAVRTARFLKYFKENPACRLFAVSGTISKQSLKDYAHLSELALKDGSPLPNHFPTLEEWAEAIDANEKKAVKPMGALAKLCKSGETVRQGFRRRLVETSGVVATEEGALDTRLLIAEREFKELPADVREKVGHVREDWERPDGEQLVDPISKAAVARQLACGFYYIWRWPRGETKEQIDKWLEARKNWRKELRHALRYQAREHMDSPMLLALAATRWHDGYWVGEAPDPCPVCKGEPPEDEINPEPCRTCGGIGRVGRDRKFIPPRTKRGPLPSWDSEYWPEWRDLRDTCQPETDAVWVNDFLARDAAEWARHKPGIVWYEHAVFGARVAELGGIKNYGGGMRASSEILTEPGNRSIVASIKAHGTGKNLQVFSRNLIANPPSDGAAWEQLLARTHRPHQKAEEVIAEVYRHTPEMCNAFDRAVARARYIQETLGSKQKLLYADITFEFEILDNLQVAWG